jgi:hypothetical protein
MVIYFLVSEHTLGIKKDIRKKEMIFFSLKYYQMHMSMIRNLTYHSAEKWKQWKQNVEQKQNSSEQKQIPAKHIQRLSDYRNRRGFSDFASHRHHSQPSS